MFIYIHPIIAKILDVEFLNAIRYRFSRTPKEGCLSDIYDGEVYQQHSEFFKCEYNMSFTFNFDGAPKFKSSTMQIWPIQLFINELPPSMLYVCKVYNVHACMCLNIV